MLTREQLQANIIALEKQGAPQADIQAYLNSLKPQTQEVPKPTPSQEADKKSAETYGALVPAVAGKETLVSGGLKTLGNYPSSAWNLAKSAGKLLTLPFDQQAQQALGKTIIGGVQKLIPGKQKDEESFNQLTQALKDRYVGLENLERTAINDPVGLATDVLSILGGGAALIGKGATLGKAISKTAQVVTKPVAKSAETLGGVAKSTTKFGVSQATGLSPETINTIIRNPEAFSAAEKSGTTRLTVASKVKKSIDAAIDDLSGLGKEYETIRATKTPVIIPEGTIKSVLSKYGLSVKERKIITTAESRPLSPGDITNIEHFINQFGEGNIKTPNALLNARKALDNLSSWDASKTEMSDIVARDLRKAYDTQGKKQISGLTELDTKYAPEAQLLKQIKKDYIKPDGTLKDGAISKIANLIGKGKEKVLDRLERIEPGITKDIKIVKALEDVEVTKGQKVGTYVRALTPGAVAFGLGGVPGAILGVVSAILASPTIAVALLKTYGRLVGASSGLIARIVSKLEHGIPLKGEEKIIMRKVIEKKALELPRGPMITPPPADRSGLLPSNIRPGYGMVPEPPLALPPGRTNLGTNIPKGKAPVGGPIKPTITSALEPLVQDAQQAISKGISKEEWIKGQGGVMNGVRYLDPKDYSDFDGFIRDIEKLNADNTQKFYIGKTPPAESLKGELTPLDQIKVAQKLWGNKAKTSIQEIPIKDIKLVERPLVNKPFAGRKIENNIQVYHENGKFNLIDGRHRLDQAIANGQTHIRAEVSGQSKLSQLSSLYDEAAKGRTNLGVTKP